MSEILILSASVGNGHVSAAKALEAEAVSRGVGVLNLDMLDVTSAAFRSWYAGGYESLVRRFPSFWGVLYRASDRPGFTFQFQTMLDRIFCRPIEAVIKERKPDWVVCTHSLPQPTLAKLRAKYGFRIAVCVTDLHPHLMWLRGAPDRYFVPAQHTIEALSQRVPEFISRTVLSGMPIHPAFRPNEAAPRERTILVSSGGIGGGPVLEVLKVLSVVGEKTGCKIVAVAGRNPRLYQDLKGAKLPSCVEVHGQLSLEDMACQMKNASILVGKPGGLTTFESLAVGLPMVVYKPFVIPGQEEDNARFLVEIGAGRTADILNGLMAEVTDLLSDQIRLSVMRKAALRNSLPNAAASIIEDLIA